MWHRGRILQKSIFSRLMFTFIIILIPIYLLSVGIHKWGVEIIRTEIINSMESQLDYHKTVLENEFFRIQYLQNECKDDEDLLKLANISESLSDFEKAQSMNRLLNRLSTLKNSSIYIEDAEVVIPTIDRAFSANKGIIPISDKEDEIIHSFLGSKITRLVNDNNELYSRVRNMSLDNKANPHFVLQIKFSNEMLKDTFSSFNAYKGSGALLLYLDQNYLLSTVGDCPIIKQIESNIKRFDKSENNCLESVSSEGTRYLTFYQKLNYNNIWLVAYVPEEQVFLPLSKYVFVLWLFTMISVIIVLYFSFSTHKFLQRPLKQLVSAFKRVEAGELKFSIQHNTNDEFQYLYTRFNAMIEYINNLIAQVYTQKIVSQKAELKQLQSQINPHFLYNSFFILQRMIQGYDNENAIRFSNYLGQYFQYVTRNGQDEMPLYKEVGHVRNYMEIQAIRFSRTTIEFEELPSKYKDLHVPRLILQPIIENAFEHGFNRNVDRRIISVRFTETEDGLYCIVEDNGSSFEDSDLDELNKRLSEENTGEVESTGLINVNKRIRLKFGGRSGIVVSRSEMGGWKVVIFFEVEGEQNV